MFEGVTFSISNYDDPLSGCSTLTLQSGVNFHGGNSQYTDSSADARQYIIDTFDWIIINGGYLDTSSLEQEESAVAFLIAHSYLVLLITLLSIDFILQIDRSKPFVHTRKCQFYVIKTEEHP